ncbi:MAG: hypothetical protein ACYDHT_10720 [Solirubrobacteraceae bacterium]
MGKRSRNRQRRSSSAPTGVGDGDGARDALRAPTGEYSDAHGDTLVLRGSLTPAARAEYAKTLAGQAGPGARAAATQEDAWQRAVELLFERLAVSWTISGAPIERQGELLARFRAASRPEREWVRQTLREHCAEHFPDVQAP